MAVDTAVLKKAASNISRWAKKAEWEDDLWAVLAEHVGEAFDLYDIGFDDLRDSDKAAAAMLFSAVMDDMCSRFFFDDPDSDSGRNLVDDYLKRGYREPAPARRYLEALQRTPTTVVEVLEVGAGHWAEVRDLIEGGSPIRVREHAGTHNLSPGLCIATKLLGVNGEMLFSGSLVPLSRATADILVQAYREGLGEIERQAASQADWTAEEIAFETELSAMALKLSLAPAATQVWLRSVLHDMLSPPPEQDEEDEAAEADAGPQDTDAEYRLMLDEPSQVLGWRTPRQMAQSAKKKHRDDAALFVIVMEMAETEARKARGEPPYDGSWMWEELGLDDPRKAGKKAKKG